MTDGSATSIETLLAGFNGKPTKKPGRTQLTNEFRGQLQERLAQATGEEPAAFDIRTMNAANQTSRAIGESMQARQQQGRTNKSWVFLSRVAKDETAIATAMRNRLGSFCSFAILFSEQNSDWKPYAAYYAEGFRDKCVRACEAVGFDEALIEPFATAPEASETPDQVSESVEAVVPPSEIFLDDDSFAEILRNLHRKKNVVLAGPPGVGKTLITDALAQRITQGADSASVTKIQFHPSYSYEDFVRGWRPDGSGGFEIVDGVIATVAANAKDDPESRHVVIIDEINRANVTKVFGEALSLVEATKRGPSHSVRLPYSKEEDEEPFYVPKNVFIIGTMNSADRSIAMVDFALRRRFSFFGLSPAFGSPKFEQVLLNAGVPGHLVAELFSVMDQLNKTISEDKDLGSGYEIGHSYFVPAEPIEDARQWLKDIVNTELAPLLREYWYDTGSAEADNWIVKLSRIAETPDPAQTPATAADEPVPALESQSTATSEPTNP